MCVSEADCGGQASCVAGRCVPHGATPAIAGARRLLVAPTQVGWLSRAGRGPGDVARLGRGDGAEVLMQFALPLAADARVLEAYVLVARAPEVDVDPGAVTLHAERVTEAWDPRSLAWGRQPALEELGLPRTSVTSASGALVRVDVRALVQRWQRRGPGEFGVALVAEGSSATGVAVALAPVDVPTDRGDSAQSPAAPPAALAASSPFDPRPVSAAAVGNPRRQTAGPALELYVR